MSELKRSLAAKGGEVPVGESMVSEHLGSPGGGGSPGQMVLAGFEGPDLPADLETLATTGRLGGFVLFQRNLPSETHARALLSHLTKLVPPETPLLIGIDQEGGRVQRLPEPWTRWPSMQILGAINDGDTTEQVGVAIGTELRELGFNLNLAPCADVARGPQSVIGDRSFGSDGNAVAQHVRNLVRGFQTAGVAACAKHFPGHGATPVDSHDELPHLMVDSKTLSQIDLAPFRAAIEVGIDLVMAGHLLVPVLDQWHPSPFSTKTLSLLRNELGFQGVIATDDLDMAAVASRYTPRAMVEQGTEAGVDLFLCCRDRRRLYGLLEALDRCSIQSLVPSIGRVQSLRKSLRRNPKECAGVPPYTRHRELATSLSLRAAQRGQMGTHVEDPGKVEY